MMKSGVYEISCGDCEKKYIGQTARNLKTRIDEHRRCLTNNSHSEFANHIIESNHSFHTHTIKLLHHITHKSKIMDNFENMEIQKNINTDNNIINNILFPNTSPLLSLFPIRPRPPYTPSTSTN